MPGIPVATVRVRARVRTRERGPGPRSPRGFLRRGLASVLAIAVLGTAGLADNSVGRLIEGLLQADLVIVDDLGFAPLDDAGAQLLFRFVAAAYERPATPTG